MRDTTDGSQHFDIGFLQKNDYLDSFQKYGSIHWSSNGEPRGDISISAHMGEYPYLNLNYTITSHYSGEKRSVDYDVRLVSTPCNFGGKRWWFLCWNCSHKATILYRSASDKFLCRKCNDLAYPSQNVNRRSIWHQVGTVLDTDKVEDLPQSRGKYQYYKGVATRKFRKVLTARYKANRSADYLKMIGWY
jgi:hypothetical protein